MTLIRFFRTRPTADGTRVPASGTLRFTPTRERVVVGDPDELILPIGFSVQVPKDTGRADVDLAPTGTGWVWEVYSHSFGVTAEYAYVVVPEPVADPVNPGEFLPVDEPDLVRVDKDTLDPAAVPDPAWWAELEAAKALASDVELARVDAAGSATSAAQSATDADVSAGEASGSASNAAASALSASDSATQAGTSADLASTSATQASTALTGAESARDATVVAAGGSELSAQAAANAATASAQSAATAEAAALDVVTRANNGEFKGDDGDPTAFELRGTGSPLGVVAAPPGTYYTDTTGAFGAWRWLKVSGTGNTGWIVTVGDTGVRQYTNEFLQSGFTQYIASASHRPRVSRVGGTVFWSGTLANIQAGAAGGGIICDVPLGYRPLGVANAGIIRGFGGTSSVPSTPLTVDGGKLKLQYPTQVDPALSSGPLVFSYQADTAWPTTLPGIPA